MPTTQVRYNSIDKSVLLKRKSTFESERHQGPSNWTEMGIIHLLFRKRCRLGTSCHSSESLGSPNHIRHGVDWLLTMLWIDKYQPRKLEDLLCHAELTQLLQRIVASGQLPHLIFYGGSGGGKKTRISAVLRSLFGEAVDRVRLPTCQCVNVRVCCVFGSDKSGKFYSRGGSS